MAVQDISELTRDTVFLGVLVEIFYQSQNSKKEDTKLVWNRMSDLYHLQSTSEITRLRYLYYSAARHMMSMQKNNKAKKI